jgi:hypothetical protein
MRPVQDPETVEEEAAVHRQFSPVVTEATLTDSSRS